MRLNVIICNVIYYNGCESNHCLYSHNFLNFGLKKKKEHF